MEIEPLVKELLEAGVHFGHQTHRWNPKMKRFIFGEKNGIYVVDLQKTATGLASAQEFLRKLAAEGGPILFVGTKRQAQPIIQQEATRCGQFYVNFRWLGGLLTNFQTVRRSIERLKAIRAWREDGTLERMTKKEAARAEKELARLERVLVGIVEMGRLPKALILVDAKREETAIKEASRLGIPVVALVDTNSDPDPIAYVIPGNDDAIRSIQLVIGHLADAVLEGHQAYLAGVAETKAREETETRARAAAEEAAARAAAGEEPEAGPPQPEAPASTVTTFEEVEGIVPEGALRTKLKEAEQTPSKEKKVSPRPKAKKVPKETPEKEGPPANA